MFSRREMPPTQPSSLVVIERDGNAELIRGAESTIQNVILSLGDAVVNVTWDAARYISGQTVRKRHA